MSHTVREKTKLLGRVRRIRGQVEAVERALEAEAECAEILQLVASIKGAMNGLTAELIEDHVRLHVTNPDTETDLERAEATRQLIDVIRSYMK